MNGNFFIAWILRSPLHGMLSNGMMLITVTGRKTGKKYTTPVGYYESEGCLWTITSRDRTWWRNLRDGAGVNLRLKGKDARAFADIVSDDESVRFRLAEFLTRVPQAARSFKIRMDDKTPNAEDLARVAKDRLFVRMKLA